MNAREASHPEAPLLILCDEAHLHLDTDLGWGWARRGSEVVCELRHAVAESQA